jgi:hypothetical protein
VEEVAEDRPQELRLRVADARSLELLGRVGDLEDGRHLGGEAVAAGPVVPAAGSSTWIALPCLR